MLITRGIMLTSLPMPRKKLVRSTKDRVLAGVISGLGQYLKMDVTILRILAVVLFIVAPLPMIILYLAAVFLIPREGETKPLAESFDISQHKTLIAGLILILIAAAFAGGYSMGAILLFSPYGFLAIFQGVIAAILMLIGIIMIITHLRKL